MLVICETKFDFVTDDSKCKKAAESYHDFLAKERRRPLLEKLIKQQESKKVRDNALSKFNAEIDKTKDAEIAAYAAQLRACKPLGALPACVEDCSKWVAMLRKDYDITPANITLLASEENFE